MNLRDVSLCSFIRCGIISANFHAFLCNTIIQTGIYVKYRIFLCIILFFTVLPEHLKRKTQCEVCGGKGDLLCCNNCRALFHYECLSPSDKREASALILSNQWKCPLCTKVFDIFHFHFK